MASDNGERTVLFLCTGNSARSILAEAILNDRGAPRFTAFSAGSHPVGRINPGAMDELARRGHATDGLRSKSWDEFTGPSAPTVHYVFTVCDNAAGESCPVWHGAPISAHWGIPDPAAVTGSPDEVRTAFRTAYEQLSDRIDGLLRAPLDRMSDEEARAALDAIGRKST